MGNNCVQLKQPGSTSSTSLDSSSLCGVSNMKLKQLNYHQQSYTNKSSNDKDYRHHQSHYTLKGERLNMNDSSVIGKQDLISSDCLGQGGFGSVFAARLKDRTKILSTINKNSHHQNNGEYWFAVKEMKKNKINTTKKGIRMLIGELAALKRLTSHPFIVQCEFAFSTEHACILGLDMCLGGDLRTYIYNGTNFSEREVGFFAACLLSAVDHMHVKGVIHRDIKPENIILDQRGYPHITDFGVAYVQDTNDMNASDQRELECNLSSGTKQYLAPEVFTKAHVHGRAVDYWSIGVMLFELIYNHRPFQKACPSAYVNFLQKDLNCNYSTNSIITRCKIQNQVSASSYLSSSMNSKDMSIELDPAMIGNLPSGSSDIASSEMSVTSCSSPTKGSHIQSPGFTPPSPLYAVKPLVAGKPLSTSTSTSSGETDNVSISPIANSISSNPPTLPPALRVRIPNVSYNQHNKTVDVTAEARDFISHMLHVIPSCRLGMGGFDQIRDHKWMSTCSIRWNSLLSKQTRPPFTPPVNVVDRSPDKNGYTLSETRKVDHNFSLVPGYTAAPYIQQYQNNRNNVTTSRNKSNSGHRSPALEDSKNSDANLHYFSEHHFGADDEETKAYDPTDCVAIEARSPRVSSPHSPFTTVPNTLDKKLHHSSSKNNSSNSRGGSNDMVHDDWPINELLKISDRGLDGANEIFKRFSHMSEDFSSLYNLLRSNNR